VRVLGEGGEELPRGTSGHLALKLPLPPGCATTLWENDEGFAHGYLSRFPGFYQTADGGFIDEDGYVWVMGRTDDVINVAGHRLSTGAIEEVLAGHPDVAECAVIGARDALKGQLPLGFVVLKQGVVREAGELEAELVACVREQIGPVAAFKRVCVVARLPKTRSGKLLRGTLRKIVDGDPWRTPPTIEDPAALDEIRAAIARPELPSD
jgi:propionyl-CoA synthetase